MNISEKKYDEKIKPFFDKLIAINLSDAETNLVGDVVIELLKNEFDFEALKKDVSSLTNLQTTFLKEKGLEKEFEDLKEALNGKDMG